MTLSTMLNIAFDFIRPNRRTLAALVACVVAVNFAVAGPNPDKTGSASEVSADHSAVKVTTKRDGDLTHFFVENQEYAEVTMTFEMGLVNLKGDVTFPFTATFAPRQVSEAFTLSPEDCGKKWEFDYTNYFKLGSKDARHDDHYVYLLPYSTGAKYKVTQGYNGKFSHTGSNQYAIDWQMPEGTPVRAARDGVVVRTKDTSDKGGSSMDYDRFNNYVLIRHDDGTLAHYCHLKKGGVVVKVGQKVEAGDLIAHSGNTGFSSGPHLHFCVFKAKNGRERESIPVKFKTSTDAAITLVSGRSYRSTEPQKPPAPITTASASSLEPARR